MIYFDKPENFNCKFEVSGCFLEKDGKFLLLLRHDSKPQGNTWGLPAGKLEKNENALDAIHREIEEEIGYKTNKDNIKFAKTVYVKYSDYDFVYHMYALKMIENHEIKLDFEAHKTFRWVTPKEALNLNLIQDLEECIKIFFALNSSTENNFKPPANSPSIN